MFCVNFEKILMILITHAPATSSANRKSTISKSSSLSKSCLEIKKNLVVQVVSHHQITYALKNFIFDISFTELKEISNVWKQYLVKRSFWDL